MISGGRFDNNESILLTWLEVVVAHDISSFTKKINTLLPLLLLATQGFVNRNDLIPLSHQLINKRESIDIFVVFRRRVFTNMVL